MDPATRARLFEPYFTTKPPGRGTGLGLTTVKSIVGRAGGRVSVESGPGKGTAIHIDLPAVEDTAAGGPTDGPGDSADRRPTILVVEDDVAVRTLTRYVLDGAGYTILEAADGPAALRIAETHAGPIHLLVTDLLMPGMTGRQLADRLTALRPGLKVLYLSGLGADAAAASHPGAAFLEKPFRPADLTRLVTQLIGA
jgi:CheY-like chemotaxis protein